MRPPEVAVIVPLEDPRGDVVEHLRTWTRQQTLERDRFQVVGGADGRHPEFERLIADELAPQDTIVAVAGASLMGLYDAAARTASAPVLVFTEAHVRAEPGCLAAVAEAFNADPELDVGTLKHQQSTSSGGISEFSERWFERAFAAWDEAGWIRLNTTAVAIRGDAYARVGGLDSRLGLYAPSLMSAQLDWEGARTKHLDDAVITHELEHEMGFALELGGDFARGECVVRREQDPEFCQRYFGSGGLWERRLAYREEIAGPMLAALASAARRSPRDARWLGRELLARLPARLGGTRPRRAWERTRTRVHEAVAALPLAPAETRWRSYTAAHETNVRAVQLREMAVDDGIPATRGEGAGAIPAGRLDGLLVGAYGLERQGDQSFRWTEPVALLRVRPPAGGAVLRIDTGGLRGAPLDYLHGIYAAGLPLSPELISGDEGAIRAHMPPDFARTAAETGIILICRPFAPARDGSSDRRRLGMPIVEVELNPLRRRDEGSQARSTAHA